jgi:hypothetical protein
MDRSIGNGAGNGCNGNSGFERPARSQQQDRTWTDIIQEEPIAFLAIAAAAGFLLGGGARRAGGLTILTMLGQVVVREALGEAGSLGDIFGEPREKTT